MTRPDAARFTRRQVLACAAGAFVVAGLPPLFARGRRRVWRRSLPIMGTFADLTVVHDDRATALAAIDAAFAELRRTDALLSRFRADSDVGRANAGAAQRAVEVGPEAAEVLDAALAWAAGSDGRFDPALGRMTALWSVNERTAPPSADQVAALAGRRLHTELDLRRTSRGARVRFASTDVALDLGGIGKGWGVDRAASALRAFGVTRGFVNVGGDLVALGTSAEDAPWRVGVRDPRDPTAILGTLDLVDAAVATSGDAEQRFLHGGRRYHHLLDPATGEPVLTHARSLTVRAPRCLDADAAATAFFGLDAGSAQVGLARLAPGAAIVS
ncbi:MAG: FAD:protein FMN transferase [Planctomycetota bacterium]|jgi:thiamine biosynthesis lipoprotein